MATANHTSWPENNARASAAQVAQTFQFKQSWRWYEKQQRLTKPGPNPNNSCGLIQSWPTPPFRGNTPRIPDTHRYSSPHTSMSRIVIARSDTASTQPHIALDASHWHVWARTRQRQSRRQYGKRPPTDAALLLDNVRLQRVAFRAFEGAKLPPAAIRKQIASDLLARRP